MTSNEHEVSEYTIAVPDDDLEDLRERLRRTRFPEDFGNDDWRYGYNGDYHRELVRYWLEEYEWRDVEQRMNELPHFTTQLMGVPLHVLHVRGKGPDPVPLLLHHGWPWTFWDLRKVIGPLTDPAAHGGDPADSFDVVLISLPGYGFSSPLVAFQKHGGVDSGRCTAKTLSESIKSGGIVALGGVQDSTTSQTRVAGLKDELKKYPDVKLLDVRPANWDPQVAFQEMQNLIAKYGDQIKGVWAADDGMIIGALEAVDKSALKGKVKFTSDGLYPPVIDVMKRPHNPIVGETFHRGYMASSMGLYTAYLAATGQMDPSKLPHEKRDSIFKIACVTPANLTDYTKYDTDIPGWIDTLIKNGPWNVAPVPLVAGGPEKLP